VDNRRAAAVGLRPAFAAAPSACRQLRRTSTARVPLRPALERQRSATGSTDCAWVFSFLAAVSNGRFIKGNARGEIAAQARRIFAIMATAVQYGGMFPRTLASSAGKPLPIGTGGWRVRRSIAAAPSAGELSPRSGQWADVAGSQCDRGLRSEINMRPNPLLCADSRRSRARRCGREALFASVGAAAVESPSRWSCLLLQQRELQPEYLVRPSLQGG
jgi:hypothetical protein